MDNRLVTASATSGKHFSSHLFMHISWTLNTRYRYQKMNRSFHTLYIFFKTTKTCIWEWYSMSSTHADPDWKFPVTKKKKERIFLWQQMFSSGRHREKKRRHQANSIRSQSDAASPGGRFSSWPVKADYRLVRHDPFFSLLYTYLSLSNGYIYISILAIIKNDVLEKRRSRWRHFLPCGSSQKKRRVSSSCQCRWRITSHSDDVLSSNTHPVRIDV